MEGAVQAANTVKVNARGQGAGTCLKGLAFTPSEREPRSESCAGRRKAFSPNSMCTRCDCGADGEVRDQQLGSLKQKPLPEARSVCYKAQCENRRPERSEYESCCSLA